MTISVILQDTGECTYDSESVFLTVKVFDLGNTEEYSRQVESLFEFGSRHEEGIEHGHSLRKHGDLQLLLILRTAGKKVG